MAVYGQQMMKNVAVIDYDICNVDSICRAVQECGAHPVATYRESDIKHADCVILPGVGSFPDGMRNLQARELPDILHTHVVVKEVPLLGICLGMQLMATRGFEGTPTDGLGWIEGEVRRLEPTRDGEKIPHIGWNEVEWERDCLLSQGIPEGSDFYFVHSYHFDVFRPEEVVAQTPYAGRFVSCVRHKSLFGVQFHPEKSQRLGFQLLRNFLQF
jgi:glutamine amidotransferase